MDPNKQNTKKENRKNPKAEAWKRKWVSGGFSYHAVSDSKINKAGQTVTYVRCIKDFVRKNDDPSKKCPVSGKFVDEIYIPSKNNYIHNHDPDHNLIEDMKFRNSLKTYSKVFAASTKSVYMTSEINDPNAATRHCYQTSRRLIQYYKKKEQPLATSLKCSNVHNLNTFVQSLGLEINNAALCYGTNNEWKISTHYEKFDFVTNNKTKNAQNLYIYDEDLLHELGEAVEGILIDATFKAVPHFNKKNIQFLTIMTKIEGNSERTSAAIPIFWAIMTNKGEECYSRVFQFLKENFPKFNPFSYMSDFEIGFHNAIEAAFPNIEVNHCYFHYAQALMKKCTDLGLINKKNIKPDTNPEIYIVIKQLIALALLTPKLITMTFEKIKTAAWEKFGSYFDELFSYYNRFWLNIVKPESFSVYNSRADRTNNYIESYHRTLNMHLSKNPHPNQLFSILKYLAFDSRVVKDSIKLNKYIKKTPEKKYRDDSAEFIEFWDKLDDAIECIGEDEIDGLDLINNLRSIKLLQEKEEYLNNIQ